MMSPLHSQIAVSAIRSSKKLWYQSYTCGAGGPNTQNDTARYMQSHKATTSSVCGDRSGDGAMQLLWNGHNLHNPIISFIITQLTVQWTTIFFTAMRNGWHRWIVINYEPVNMKVKKQLKTPKQPQKQIMRRTALHRPTWLTFEGTALETRKQISFPEVSRVFSFARRCHSGCLNMQGHYFIWPRAFGTSYRLACRIKLIWPTGRPHA